MKKLTITFFCLSRFLRPAILLGGIMFAFSLTAYSQQQYYVANGFQDETDVTGSILKLNGIFSDVVFSFLYNRRSNVLVCKSPQVI